MLACRLRCLIENCILVRLHIVTYLFALANDYLNGQWDAERLLINNNTTLNTILILRRKSYCHW